MPERTSLLGRFRERRAKKKEESLVKEGKLKAGEILPVAGATSLRSVSAEEPILSQEQIDTAKPVVRAAKKVEDELFPDTVTAPTPSEVGPSLRSASATGDKRTQILDPVTGQEITPGVAVKRSRQISRGHQLVGTDLGRPGVEATQQDVIDADKAAKEAGIGLRGRTEYDPLEETATLAQSAFFKPGEEKADVSLKTATPVIAGTTGRAPVATTTSSAAAGTSPRKGLRRASDFAVSGLPDEAGAKRRSDRFKNIPLLGKPSTVGPSAAGVVEAPTSTLLGGLKKFVTAPSRFSAAALKSRELDIKEKAAETRSRGDIRNEIEAEKLKLQIGEADRRADRGEREEKRVAEAAIEEKRQFEVEREDKQAERDAAQKRFEDTEKRIRETKTEDRALAQEKADQAKAENIGLLRDDLASELAVRRLKNGSILPISTSSVNDISRRLKKQLPPEEFALVEQTIKEGRAENSYEVFRLSRLAKEGGFPEAGVYKGSDSKVEERLNELWEETGRPLSEAPHAQRPGFDLPEEPEIGDTPPEGETPPTEGAAYSAQTGTWLIPNADGTYTEVRSTQE